VVKDIWDAVKLDPDVRERERLLSDVSIAILKRIDQKGWTQKEAARQMGVTQPRISDLKRQKLDLFSIDSLVSMAGKAGIHFDIDYRFDK
jgi:predicted XRE-type DNA-binding protein